MLPPPTPERDREADLHLLDCARCQEPMYHRVAHMLATYPLANLWLAQCGECGRFVEAWEDIPQFSSYAGNAIERPP